MIYAKPGTGGQHRQTVLNVLPAFDPDVKGRTIDLRKTSTTDFAVKVNQTVK
jgi:hypothetical protein